MPPKSKIPKIEVVTEHVGDFFSDDEGDDGTAPQALEKPKRARSEAQIKSFEKAKETKRLNFLKRKGLEDKKEEEIQKLVMLKQEKKEKKQKKLKELEVFAEPEVESDEEEQQVIIKKKVKKQTKAKVIYVDSDDEEVEKPIDKNIIIINKMHPNLTHSKPKLVKEKPSFVFL